MAMFLKENVSFFVAGDGVTATCVVDLSASPISKVFDRRFPDRATVTAANAVLVSAIKNSIVSFTFPTPPGAGFTQVNVALEYDT